jgi:nucleoredoxin
MFSSWTNLLGTLLWTKKQSKESTEDLLKQKKIIGLYFTASWCRPCREFAPILSTVYRNMSLSMYTKSPHDLKMHKEFEIIMISLDKNENEFQQYHLKTPFLALPFERKDILRDLWTMYEIKNIPTLLLLNENGQVLTREGKQLIEENYLNIPVLWERLLKLHIDMKIIPLNSVEQDQEPQL